MENRKDTKVVMKSRKRRSDDGDLDITPMIDITFLLLAFFVVVSKMDPTTLQNMPRAKYGETVAENTAVVFIVDATDADEPVVYRGKARSDTAKCGTSIEDIEDQIAEYVEDQMKADALLTCVIIKAERKVINRHLFIVKSAITRSLGEDQTIYVGIEEE